MSFDKYYEHYKDNGFHFGKPLLTRYALSLYTKPFVILSGISGTGKTKIAQLFNAFEETVSVSSPAKTLESNQGSFIILNITSGVFSGDGRGNLKFSDLAALFEIEDIPNIQARIEEEKEKGSDDNIIEPEVFIVESSDGEFKINIYLQRASSPLLRVRFISKRGESPRYNSQEYIRKHYQVGDKLKLEKIGPRRLKVISVNDVEVEEIIKVLDEVEQHEINNKLFVAVKSNWNDSTELFGYYNVLDEKYYLTPLLKFMLTAKENPTKPFFLILDEMNLSRVEHYFSDYLSCLESRVIIDDTLHQEKIQLHNFPSYVDSNDNYFDVIPNRIEIPTNLYVTGTVNIDETTYTFSPKVLDRANVIEFNEVTLSAYGESDNTPNDYIFSEFPPFHNALLATSKEFNNTPQSFKDTVNSFLKILQPYNLHFGYRVINEMSLFVNNSVKYVGGASNQIDAAIDYQISQKVLTKLNGAFGKLDEPVRKLIEFMLHDASVDYSIIDVELVQNISPKDTKYPESLSKLCKLYKSLVYNGFASFLE